MLSLLQPASATIRVDAERIQQQILAAMSRHGIDRSAAAIEIANISLSNDLSLVGTVLDPTIVPLINIEATNVATARTLTELLERRSGNDLDATLATARIAIAHRRSLLGRTLDRSLAPLLDQQARNIDLLEALERGSGRASILAGVRLAGEWQRRSLRATRDTERFVPGARYTIPSVAARALVARFRPAISPENARSLRALDRLPSRLRSATLRVLNAFLDFDAASSLAYPGSSRLDASRLAREVERLGSVRASGDTISASRSTLSAPAISRVLAARDELAAAAFGLSAAAAATKWVAIPAAMRYDGVYSIDFSSDDNIYKKDVALLIDGGGADTYLNNAGGSNLHKGSCTFAVGDQRAAAAFDLDGNDRYTSGRSCGQNGGGTQGAGFLYDAAGNDAYQGGHFGVNGGAIDGAGFLLDLGGTDSFVGGDGGTNGGAVGGVGFLRHAGAGNDTYRSGTVGANGGADSGAVAMLIDDGGADSYSGLAGGINGGGSSAAVGFLLDRGPGRDSYSGLFGGVNGGAGNGGSGFLADMSSTAAGDTYIAGGVGTNGGAVTGVGMLIDEAGRDVYSATSSGVNGGGGLGGAGHLIDMRGNDRYVSSSGNGSAGVAAAGLLVDAAGSDSYVGLYYANGAAGGQSVGFLLDIGGDDSYSASDSAASIYLNGAGTGGSVGFLMDTSGDDVYAAGDLGSNGGGTLGVGMLLDVAGNDRYTAGDNSTNGGGREAAGHLIDTGGNDVYRAGRIATNGGGAAAGVGFLFDASGNDSYVAGGKGTNGGGASAPVGSPLGDLVPAPGVGFLFDGGGIDTYQDPKVGSVSDCSVVPKGSFGAQIDIPGVIPC